MTAGGKPSARQSGANIPSTPVACQPHRRSPAHNRMIAFTREYLFVSRQSLEAPIRVTPPTARARRIAVHVGSGRCSRAGRRTQDWKYLIFEYSAITRHYCRVPKPADRNRLSTWFRDERHRAALTQLQLARRMKLRQGHISNIENGQRRLDILEFLDFAAALGTTPNILLSRLQTYVTGPASATPTRRKPSGE